MPWLCAWYVDGRSAVTDRVHHRSNASTHAVADSIADGIPDYIADGTADGVPDGTADSGAYGRADGDTDRAAHWRTHSGLRARQVRVCDGER